MLAAPNRAALSTVACSSDRADTTRPQSTTSTISVSKPLRTSVIATSIDP